MRPVLKLLLKLLLLVTFSLAIVSAASADEGDPVDFCSGTDVSGTVVAVDEELNLVTIDTGSGVCSVQLDGSWDHPVTALLGSYFDDVSAENLSTALETLSIQIVCDTPGDGEEVCDLAAEGTDSTGATILSVTEDGSGSYLVEVLLQTSEGEETKTFLFSADGEQAQAWIDALATLAVDWTLAVDEDGNPIVTKAGDEIAAYHEDGWGFGQLVKIYAIAAEAGEACAGAGPQATLESDVDFCGVTVEGLLAEFESGGGFGALFKEYGKPALLGVGHIRNADKQKNSPPANACGYWAKQDEGPILADGESDPCADFKDKGKPDWAGSPGGKPKDKDSSD